MSEINPLSENTEQKIRSALTIAVAMCLIGHGAFGIITKAAWCPYFAVFGIDTVMAYRLMPVVGACDILMGITMLIYPIAAIPVWLVIWGSFTASLRPISGEPFAEFIERAGNFGAPLALLLFSGGFKISARELFKTLKKAENYTAHKLRNFQLYLRGIVFLLFAGHGWLNLIEKKALISQYAAIRFSNPHMLAAFVGTFELAAACLILIRPSRPVIFLLFVWKMSSELFYPKYELFEWIERGESYGVLLALWYAYSYKTAIPDNRQISRPSEA